MSEVKLDGEGDLLAALPAHVAREIRQIWQTQVAGADARYKRSKDRRGVEGQKAVSALVIGAGIPRTDPRWNAIREFGRSLYYGRAPAPPRTTHSPERSAPVRLVPPTPSSGTSFRARAEAHQVWYRRDVLGVGCGAHEHHLDEVAIARGANFVSPAAHASARSRMAAGKGVAEDRTFGNMLSSQALCFNLFGPLAATEEGREIAAEALSNVVPEIASIASIAIEYTPDREVFRDQHGHVGVDVDVLLEFETIYAERGVLVIETKFVEPSFSYCGHRQGTPDDCPADVVVGEDHAACRYVAKNGYLYWARATERSTLRRSLVTERGCPFGGRLWQPWVNHTLAHAEASRRGAAHAIFAVLAAEGNEALDARGVVDELRLQLSDPSTARFFPLEEILVFLCRATARRGEEWSKWAATMLTRYRIPSLGARPDLTTPSTTRTPVTRGHRSAAALLRTGEVQALVRAFDVVAGKGRVYLRPTDKGLVMLGLHDRAPGYVGLRAHADDDSYCITSATIAGATAEAAARWAAFERWLPSVRRSSAEERGTIRWLTTVLSNGLWLPELGPGWVFLAQEWRFLDDDCVGRKSDILAVHLPTGTLGIVELKDADAKLGDARIQVDGYGASWLRDAGALAPFFTEILQAQARLYGNVEAAQAVVSAAPARLFVGVAEPGSPIKLLSR